MTTRAAGLTPSPALPPRQLHVSNDSIVSTATASRVQDSTVTIDSTATVARVRGVPDSHASIVSTMTASPKPVTLPEKSVTGCSGLTLPQKCMTAVPGH